MKIRYVLGLTFILGCTASGCASETKTVADINMYNIEEQSVEEKEVSTKEVCDQVAEETLENIKKMAAEETEAPAETKVQETTAAKETETATERKTEADTEETSTTSEAKDVVTETVSVEQNTIDVVTAKTDTEAVIKMEVEELIQKHMAQYEEVLKYVNEIRAEAGVAPLTLDVNLCRAATYRAVEINNEDCFSHIRPDGTRCFTVFKLYGIEYKSAGENIAAGYSDPKVVVEAWKNSPAHYENLVCAKFTKMGAGYSDKPIGYQYYWTQFFTN